MAIKYKPTTKVILLADNSRLRIKGKGAIIVEWNECFYDVDVNIVTSLVAPMVLGMDVLRRHKSVTMNFKWRR